MKLLISKAATRDIREIWQFSASRWSGAQADRYYGMIMDELQQLLVRPDSGIPVRDLKGNYLRSRVGSHFIFYRIDREQSALKVIRILHQRMDPERRLYP